MCPIHESRCELADVSPDDVCDECGAKIVFLAKARIASEIWDLSDTKLLPTDARVVAEARVLAQPFREALTEIEEEPQEEEQSHSMPTDGLEVALDLLELGMRRDAMELVIPTGPYRSIVRTRREELEFLFSERLLTTPGLKRLRQLVSSETPLPS